MTFLISVTQIVTKANKRLIIGKVIQALQEYYVSLSKGQGCRERQAHCSASVNYAWL